MLIRMWLVTSIRIRILVRAIRICDHWSRDGLNHEPSRLHWKLPRPQRLHFEALKFFVLTSVRIRIQLFTVMRIRIQLPIKSRFCLRDIRICIIPVVKNT
jgi:hypothetical protein